MMKGWYFTLGQKEIFVKSDRKNKTRKFAAEIIEALGGVKSEENIKYILYSICPANLEVKYSQGNEELNFPEKFWFNICGENFGGAGSEDVTDGKTLVLENGNFYKWDIEKREEGYYIKLMTTKDGGKTYEYTGKMRFYYYLRNAVEFIENF